MLQQRVEELFELKPLAYSEEDYQLFTEFRELLNAGSVRAAEPDASQPTGWRVNSWVKKGILLGFRIGVMVEMGIGGTQFFDKSTYPLKTFTVDSGVQDRARRVERPRRLLHRPGRHLHAAHVH